MPASRHDTAVLTLHRCVNYGSYWQARCLLAGLRDLGASPVLLNHDSWRVRFAEGSWALRPVRPAHVPLRDIPDYAWKILRFAQARRQMEATRRFPLHHPERAGYFPRLVIGSDEVWNLSHPWYGGSGIFFGEGLSAERRIAYAVSIGNHNPADELPQAWRDRLATFDHISVRDSNTARFVENSLGTSPDRVTDPCLHFPLPLSPNWNGPRSPFAVVYGYGFSHAFATAIRAWATSRRLPLVSIGYRNDWADRQWITASPEDFAQAMAKAQAVATNFFHGGVFALRNRRPFVCETTPYRAAKLLDLLSSLGCESHLLDAHCTADQVSERLDQSLPVELVPRIENASRLSAAWLARALE